MLHVEVQPARGALQTAGIRYVIHNEGAVRVLEVAGDEGPELLLPGRVPELESIGLVIVRDVADQEVDADGGLRG